MNNSKTPLSRVTVSRKVPFLSEVLYFPTTAFTALLHVVTKPLGLEPAASMVISGGLFGMVLIPTGSAVLFLQIVERTGIWPNATNFLVKWVCVPFFILYSFKILVLDKTHLQVEDANPATPRNWLEEMSRDFFYAGLEYFPMKCIPWSKDAELPPTKQYVIASHPHGIHCFSLMMFTSIGSDFDMKFPGLVGNSLTGIVATVIFKIPIVRELFLFMGYVDASRSVASQVLAKGRSLFVCTGGEEESMYTEFGKDIVVLKKRKGFIRLALSYGADLVPVYGLGVSDLYTVRFFFYLPPFFILICFVCLSIIHFPLYDTPNEPKKRERWRKLQYIFFWFHLSPSFQCLLLFVFASLTHTGKYCSPSPTNTTRKQQHNDNYNE